MKTSFYFVLWILIYPLFALFNNSFINENDFIVALAIVWGLSWLLKRIMPNTLAYERFSQIAPILEDVYTGNVSSFKKRLSRETGMEIITSIYFIVTTVVITLAIINTGVNDWVALVIFAFFSLGTITRSVKLIQAKSQLNSNPTQEQCKEIAEDTYKLDYLSFYEARSEASYQDIFPPRPGHFKEFIVFSIVIAVIAALLGLLYIVLGIVTMLSQSSLEIGAVGGMYFLYGSLATYFGVKDFTSCLGTKNNTRQNTVSMKNI